VTGLGPRGFLPARTPARVLPDRWRSYVDAGAEFASRYHSPDGDVRPWLDGLFRDPVPEVDGFVAGLDEPQLERLHSVVSVLVHGYRWSRNPPPADAYRLTRLNLPPGLGDVFGALARRQGHPRVGTLYSMVLSNWELDGDGGGSDYDVSDLEGDRLRVAVPWVTGERLAGLTSFLRTAIETEARGATAAATASRCVQAAGRGAAHEVTDQLERLRSELVELGAPFARNIRKQAFTADEFLTLIQPTTIWGLDEGHGPEEGPSGPQVGSLQVVDALLGIGATSPMGRAVRHTRRYLPARHRAFLEAFDVEASGFRGFVAASQDRTMTTLFNACVAAVKSWRIVHQKRGALFLRADTPGAVSAYASTGGVVALDDERVSRFEASMQERVDETTAAALPVLDDDPLTVRPFRHLSPDDLDALRSAAWVRAYGPGDVVLAAGVRRTGFYLAREGELVVRSRSGAELATLPPGSLFGEMSWLTQEPTSADVVAVGPCRVEIIPREHIFALCETLPGFAARFHLSVAALLAARLRDTSAALATARAELAALRGA
jgi:hypothetical protein